MEKDNDTNLFPLKEMNQERRKKQKLDCDKPCIDVAALLLENNALIDEEDEMGFTPLCLAAREGNTIMVKFLLDHGADVNHETVHENRPLSFAVSRMHRETAKLLVESGGLASVTDIHIMVSHHRSFSLLKEIGVNLNVADKDGWNTLHREVSLGNIAIIRTLIESGLQVNSKTEMGMTPLHFAALYGHLDVVKLLIKCGAEINARDRNNCSPIDLAVQEEKEDVVKFLKSKGAESSV